MSVHANRAAYVRSPWQFELREAPLPDPGPGQLLLEVAACAVCGTDFHVADRQAPDWQPFGHEVSGVVRRVGEGVTRFVPGDRVALDSSAPCGRCEVCLPPPQGRGRPELCRSVATYWGSPAMGYSERLLTPQECAVHVPDSVPLDVASLVEPLGVSLDLVQVAEVRHGDHVLVIGPGPLGLGAVALARRAGAERVLLAGRSHSAARLQAGLALGADGLIEVDRRPLAEPFAARRPDKILVTASPGVIPEALGLAAYGGIVAYIGVAWSPDAIVEIDADQLHFSKLSLRSSMASPGLHAASTARLLETLPELGERLISHRFALDDLPQAFATGRSAEAKPQVVKMVMVGEGAE
ncbi:MAG: zinc-binding dehydrogenase [Armatimonadetes bacterium]|nr:zinc-binding dehydrogenase [Armatimonadota bacterium]